jgi:hypothetical protein
MSGTVAVRTHALARLVAALEAACPELAKRITPEADRDEQIKWPKLGIRVVRAPFKAYDRRKVTRVGGDTVYDVGHFEALVQFRLGAPTHRQRTDLGEKLLGAFLGSGYRPGVLVTALPECHDTVAAWELDDEGWADEMAFEQKWFSTLTVTGFLPALVRTTTYKIEHLRLVVGADLTSTDPPPALVETVEVNEDGTLSQVVV